MFAHIALFVTLLGPATPDKISTVSDISYDENGEYKHRLDLYLPGSEGFPTVVFVHGGSLVSGDRKGYLEYEPYPEIGKNFAAHGVGCAVISYRLGPAHKWPTMAEDVAEAFEWVKHHIASYKGDDARLFLVGHSSGAHLASVVATDDKYVAQFGGSLKDIAGCVAISTSMHPSFDIDDLTDVEIAQRWDRAEQTGAYESVFPTPRLYRDADPMYHVSARAPRFLMMFADGEVKRTPALEHADIFMGAMAREGVRTSVEILENRDHMSTIRHMAEENDPALLLIVRFVKRSPGRR